MKRPKQPVRFVQIVNAQRTKSPAYKESDDIDFLGIDDVGRVWRLCRRMTGKSEWLLTQFHDSRNFIWTEPATKVES